MPVASPMSANHDGEWVTITELAALKRVSKQAISKRVARFAMGGQLEVRLEGRTKMVRLAEYDTAARERTDPARLIRQPNAAAVDELPAPAPGDANADPIYARELARKARYDADLKEIALKKETSQLLPIDQVVVAMERCAEAIVRDLEQLPTFADDLAEAMSKAGVPGLRDALKAKARALRETLAQTMRLAGSPDDEDDDETESE